MRREWEPGDVAMVTWPGGSSEVLFRHLRGADYDIEEWRSATDGCAYPTPDQLRPLAVIDPEDGEQVERLLDSLRGMSFSAHACGAFICLRAALRELADPTPPKPEEPKGLGAVVEDVEGVRWVRVNQRTGTQEWRCCDYNGEFRNYAAVDARRVLSEGIPEDGAR